MTKQLLIYETAVPVSAARHAGVSLDAPGGYAFAAGVNAVPVTALEIPLACREYAVVFSAAGDDTVPVAVLGMRAQQNLFLDAGSGWTARYVPTFIRRYPFVFASGTGADGRPTLTLCVDESHPGFNREGRGRRLFDDDGKPTAFLEEAAAFVRECQAQFERTAAFAREVKALDLLEPTQARVAGPDGRLLAEGNFLAVSRARLQALDDAALLRLARSGALELIHLHLQSLRNFEVLKDRLVEEVNAAGAPRPATAGLH